MSVTTIFLAQRLWAQGFMTGNMAILDYFFMNKGGCYSAYLAFSSASEWQLTASGGLIVGPRRVDA